MTLLLTTGIFGLALAGMGLALILTGENRVHGSCGATSQLDLEGVDNCAFCPNNEEEDQVTTLAKAGYPGRDAIISEEAYQNKPRRIAVEKLKYWSGRI